MKKLFYIAAIALFIGVSCKDNTKTPPVKETDYSADQRPQFNADSAYSYVEKQLSFGPRVPGTKAHALCAKYLEDNLKQHADTVIIQSFTAKLYNGTAKEGKNIIASFSPDKKNRIVLAAHWDSRMVADQDPEEKNRKSPVPGANDGASGVGVLMEIARLLKEKKPNVGVDIILFDIEDQGCPEGELSSLPANEDWCLGSQYWAKNKHLPYYQAQYGILLDMVGYNQPLFSMEEISMHFAPDVMSKVWKIASQLGYGSTFIGERTSPITDDHLFVNQYGNIPMIDIVQNSKNVSFFPYWHTINDDINVISKNTLHMVGDVVLTTLFSE